MFLFACPLHIIVFSLYFYFIRFILVDPMGKKNKEQEGKKSKEKKKSANTETSQTSQQEFLLETPASIPKMSLSDVLDTQSAHLSWRTRWKRNIRRFFLPCTNCIRHQWNTSHVTLDEFDNVIEL